MEYRKFTDLFLYSFFSLSGVGRHDWLLEVTGQFITTEDISSAGRPRFTEPVPTILC